MNQPAATCQARRVVLCRRFGTLFGALALVLSLASVPAAQESASPQSAPADQPKSSAGDDDSTLPSVPPQIAEQGGRIRYVGPDTYILLDAEGRPQPVPGMTYGDFLAAWKQTQQLQDAEHQRRYSIESIDVDGKTSDGHARLRFTARVKLLTSDAVEVPLGLLGAILQGEAEIEPAAAGPGDAEAAAHGPGDQSAPKLEYLYLNLERGGFLAHLKGRAGQLREVTLNLIVPLTRDGTETTLPLNFPRALASNLAVTINQPAVNATVNSGTLLATGRTPEGGTRLNVAGAMGSVRLTWHAGDAADAEVAAVLGAAGSIRVSIDGRSARTEARLTVKSYGGSFDRFRVRLPPGAQLVRDEPAVADTDSPMYRIAVEDESSAPDGSAAEGTVLLIQLLEKQQSPATVELSTEQPIGIESGTPVVELGGFAVLGAVRQYGDVAVEVAADWQARWNVGDHVRQVETSELDTSLQQADLSAAFQYDRQPWSLGVRITPRQFRIHATPRYELEVLPDEARIRTQLNYQVFGSRAFEFRVGLAGWELTEDPIDSGGLVDQDGIYVTADDTLVFPLAQSSSRRAEVSFNLRRAVPRDGDRIRLPLPVPLADSVGTGELVATSTAEVELLPDLAASLGLTPTPVSASSHSPDGENATRHHFRTSLPKSLFVAERISRTRDVTAKATAQLELQQAGAQVDQRFEYLVRYEPINELQFEVPAQLSFEPDQFEIMMLTVPGGSDGEGEGSEKPLSFVQSDDQAADPAADHRQLRVPLPQPRLGRFAVHIRYRVLPPSEVWKLGTWAIPLVQPVEGKVTAQSASVRTPRTLMVSLDAAATGSTWTQAASDSASEDSTHTYVAERSEPSLPLLLRAVDPNLPSQTIVERIWLQTWMSGDVRQDRAAFRFRTTASQTTIELPPRVPPDEVEVLVDGRPAEILSRGTGRILVRPFGQPAEDEAAPQEAELHTLELRYRQPAWRGLIRRHRLTPPQIVGTTTLAEVYWQVVLPGDQHIVQSPAQMTCAGQWQWLGSFWGRRPVMSQADLEKWAGASSQLAPATADSQHLFTGLAPVATIEVLTAPRWLIVLTASGGILVVVLLAMYVPRAQRKWLMIGAAILIAGLAVAFPAPALLLAQASVVGVAVAAISALVARFAARPRGWPITLSSGSSQRQITLRGDSRLMPPIGAAASTAPTASMAMPDSER